MKLDRNTTNPPRGKYALLRLREWPHGWSPKCQAAFELLKEAGAIDFGDGPDTEFFVIRLKDQYAGPALLAYARAAREDGELEYSLEVEMLAFKAIRHPLKRKPD